MVSRHGSRYPTTGANVVGFGDRVAATKAKGKVHFRDGLKFLNNWKYWLGTEILVPKGELIMTSSEPVALYHKLTDV